MKKSKLLVHPEVHRGPVGPQLGRLTSGAHFPHDGAPWRSALLASVTLPDLAHTGLVRDAPLLRPDGRASDELRTEIALGLGNLPHLPEKDIAARDDSLRAPHSQPWIADDEENLLDLVFSRKKKPTSAKTLANMLLRAEFGKLK